MGDVPSQGGKHHTLISLHSIGIISNSTTFLSVPTSYSASSYSASYSSSRTTSSCGDNSTGWWWLGRRVSLRVGGTGRDTVGVLPGLIPVVIAAISNTTTERKREKKAIYFLPLVRPMSIIYVQSCHA